MCVKMSMFFKLLPPALRTISDALINKKSEREISTYCTIHVCHVDYKKKVINNVQTSYRDIKFTRAYTMLRGIKFQRRHYR